MDGKEEKFQLILRKNRKKIMCNSIKDVKWIQLD